MADYTLKIVVDADDRASRPLRNVRGALDDAVTGMSALGGTILAGLGGAAVAGFGALTAGIAQSVKSAMEAEAVSARLASVLESTGSRAGWTAEAAEALSLSLMNITGVSDEVVTAVQAMLLQFPNMSGDVMPAMTEAALDLSRAMGIDAVNAARLLGRVMVNPAEGFGALRRAGVALTDQQEEMVRQLMETGDVAAAQAALLDILNSSVGGAARAYGETFGGQLAIARENIDNVFEALGGQLLPVMAQLLNDYIMPLIPQIASLALAFGTQLAEAIPRVITAVQAAADWLAQNQAVIVGVLAAMGAAVAAFVYTTVIPAIVAVITAAAPVIAILAAIGAAAYLLYRAWTENWGGIRDCIQGIWAQLQPVFETVRAWLAQNIPIALNTLSRIWQTVWDGIQAIFSTVIIVIQTIYEAFRAAFTGDWQTFGEKLLQLWDMLWGAIKTVLSTALSALQLIYGAFRTALSAGWQSLCTEISTGWDQLWNGVKTAFGNVRDWFAREVPQLIRRIISFFTDTDWGEIGRKIVAGIAQGIRDAIGRLIDAIREAIEAVLQAVEDLLGIQSPSRLFNQRVGRPMMTGWLRAIEQMTPRLQLAAAAAGEAALRGAQGVIPIENRTVIIYGGVTVAATDTAEDLLRQLWQMGYA